MPRNPSGTYTAPSNSFNPAVAETVIDPADWNATLADLSDAMTDSLSRTGQGGMSADLDMNNNDINEIKTVVFQGSTSGNTTVQATAIAGTTTLTLPAATDTLVGKATADTFTNKTFDTAGVGNSFLINGVAVTTNTGTGAVVRENNPTINGATFLTSTYNKVTITPPAISATLTLIDGTTLTGPAASGTVMTLGNVETVTGAKTFGAAGNVGKLIVAGNTSGSTILNATAVASGTLTLPAATDTLVGKATTDVFTNKTFNSTAAGNVLQVSGVTVSAGQYPGEPTTGNATAGNVGEYIESIIATGSATSLTTNTPKTITSISLSAGDWDVSASVSFNGAGGVSITMVESSISLTTNTVDQTAGRSSKLNQAANVPGSSPAHTLPVGPVRMSVSGATTVYVVSNQTFTIGTLAGWGIISARRAR